MSPLSKQIPEELLREWRTYAEQVVIHGCKVTEMEKDDLLAAIGYIAQSYNNQRALWDKVLDRAARP
jgi:hypothetical protein